MNLKQGDTGPAVGAVQQSLIEAGYQIDAVESSAQTYGSTTVTAVSAFQKDHGLAVDGICGPRTLDALHGDKNEHFCTPGWRWRLSECSAEVGAVLTSAIGQIGTVENPPGSNRGVKIDAWNIAAGLSLGDPWCAAFATGGAAWGVCPGGNPFETPLGSAYKILQWAEKNGRLVASTDEILPGDVALIMRTEYSGHAYLIASNMKDGRLSTCEGNAGNAVRGLIRLRSAASYYVRPLKSIAS